MKSVQLLVLVVLGRVSDGGERAALLAAFGVLAAFAIVTDSGGSSFVLAVQKDHLSRGLLRKVLAVHASTAVGGAIASMVFVMGVLGLGERAGAAGVVLVSSLALGQMLDSTTRVSKAPLLVLSRDTDYGAIDFLNAATKFPILLFALVSGDERWLMAIAAQSAVMLAGTTLFVRRLIPPTQASAPRTMAVLEVGLSGALSALYSQSAMLVGAAVLDVEGAATLAVVTRLVQAGEFVPSTFAAQALPRLVRGDVAVGALWWRFVAIGGGLCIGLCVAYPVLFQLFPILDGHLLALAVFGASLSIKSGNYVLASALLAYRMVRARIIVNIIVGCVAWPTCYLLASVGALVGLACAVVIIESVLAVAVYLTLRKRARVSEQGPTERTVDV